MKIEGDFRFEADRRAVWQALQDPRCLAATLPGVRKLEVIGTDEFAVTADVGVGSVKGLYEGTFSLADKKDFESCILFGSARGAAGAIEVEARTRLSDSLEQGTLLEYEADAKISGAIAGVGQRMITAASRKMSKDFFSALDRSILVGDGMVTSIETAGVGAVTPAAQPAVGQIFTRAPAPSDPMRNFVVGVAVGFVLALIGVAVGRRTAR